MTSASWLVPLVTRPNPRGTLICFPFGGAGATTFSRWSARLPLELDLHSVCLPGRETRASEPFVIEADEAAERLFEDTSLFLPDRTVLFGHSLGAGLAYRLACLWQKRRGAPPRGLIVSGRRPPNQTYVGVDAAEDDQRLLAHIRALGGLPEELLSDETFLAHYLPRIRADYQLNASLREPELTVLDCPISLFNGSEDPLVDRLSVHEWDRFAGRGLRAFEFPGGHFFLQQRPAELIPRVMDEVLLLLSVPHTSQDRP